MKLIKRVLLWVVLGIAALYGLAQLTDGDFARQYGMQILGVFALIGLFFGLRASSLASKEKKAAAAAFSEQAHSDHQRKTWSAEAKTRAMEVAGVCARNTKNHEKDQMITPEYHADESLDRIGRDLLAAMELCGRLQAAAERLEQEVDAS